jgi:hypothetical protein
MSGIRNTLQAKDRRQEGGFNLLQRERDLFGIGLVVVESEVYCASDPLTLVAVRHLSGRWPKS